MPLFIWLDNCFVGVVAKFVPEPSRPNVTRVSRSKSTLIQFGGVLFLMALSLIQGIVLVPLFLRSIGGELYGAWLATAGALTMVGALDLGFSKFVSHRVAVACGGANDEELGKFLLVTVFYSLAIVCAILLIGAFLAPWLPGWVGLAGSSADSLRKALWIMAMAVALLYIANVAGCVLFGLQRPAASMGGMIVGTALSLLVIWVSLSHGGGVVSLALGSLVQGAVAVSIDLVALFVYLRKRLSRRVLVFDFSLVVQVFRSMGWMVLAEAVVAIAPQVDNVVVAKVLRPTDVTVLSLTRRVSEFVVQLAARLPASFLSGLSHLYGSGEEEKYLHVVALLFRVTLYLAGFGLGGVLLLNESFVGVWVGPAFFGGKGLTGIICLYGILKTLRVVEHNVLFSRGLISITSPAAIAESVLQIGLGVVFCRVWGMPGILLAGVTAVVVSNLIQAWGLRKIFQISGRKILVSVIGLLLSVAAPMVLLGLLIHLRHPQGWHDLLWMGGVYGALCLGILGWRESDLRRYARLF